ncbi:OLC1v1036013C1 [Oldenlandia corymbosa var. corymbosa]|uniref:OLC1v1036013C1 n=1 Tax=Oldenlandia corymbosa var. corymbosa TaxID=529605 RepID=A0AAV1CVP7_OLDCO|nr:OLC1v1036013C1 [Oldenlandia corymbosa var. corymbosa]
MQKNKFLTLQKNNLRPSWDWVDQKWVEVAAKHDILWVISSLRSSSAKASESGSQRLSSLSVYPKKDVPIVHPKKRLRVNYSDDVASKELNSSLNVVGCKDKQVSNTAKINLQPSRDRVDQKWVEVAAKCDMLSVISSLRSSSAEASESCSKRLPSLAAYLNKDVPTMHPRKRLRFNYSDDVASKELHSSLNVESVAKDRSFSRRKLYKNNHCVIMVD